ncbi:hypothetical protein [Qaidamihabitans albus]|uniref:hypothetical protein n=1 Tax=Qaidamihabitans albus TaxID=2795733 RepID=UPI0018F144C4|nr:hypothetical protein [Qaidamihabitans albus]
MSGYEARIDALRAAAKAARSASEQVSEIDLAGAVAGAGAGIPGARSVGSLSTLGEAWRRDLASWVARADGYADALSTAAHNYEVNDDAAERALPAHGDETPRVG